jgi:hypothetical protein
VLVVTVVRGVDEAVELLLLVPLVEVVVELEPVSISRRELLVYHRGQQGSAHLQGRMEGSSPQYSCR